MKVTMHSLRRWIFKPKKTDKTPLAQFYYADEALNDVAAELESFDGRKNPERCSELINKLRSCQDKLLNVVEKIMDDAIPSQRASRDFRVKFPDDVIQDNLGGQLWFGAECLAAGSSIMNREVESASMRPLAKTLTSHLDNMRRLLREQSLRSTEYSQEIKTGLVLFDKLFAEFELSYVSSMVPVKTMREYDVLQEVMVLFSETVQRAIRRQLITTDMIDFYDPSLMFSIPRLAIITGLYVYPDGPLNPDMDPQKLCEMFRPFQMLLYKIRELLSTLSAVELLTLEKTLCADPNAPEDSRTAKERAAATLEAERERMRQKLHRNIRRYVSEPHAETTTDGSSLSDSGDVGTDADGPDADRTSLTSSADEDERASGLNEARDDSRDSQPEVEEPDVAAAAGASRSMPIASTQTVTSQRLRHSKSWPNRTERRRSSTTAADVVGDAADDASSLLDIAADSVDDVSGARDDATSNQLSTRARSSHEFTFSIPADSSQSTGAVQPEVTSPPRTHCEPPAANCLEDHTDGVAPDDASLAALIPVATATAHASFVDPLPPVASSTDSSSTNSPTSGPRVSFVTEALMEAFITEPAAVVQDGAGGLPSNSVTVQPTAVVCTCHELNNNASQAVANNAAPVVSSSVTSACDTRDVTASNDRVSDERSVMLTSDSSVCPSCSTTTTISHQSASDASDNADVVMTTAANNRQQPVCSNCTDAVSSAPKSAQPDVSASSSGQPAHVFGSDVTARRQHGGRNARRYFRSQSCPQAAGRRGVARHFSDSDSSGSDDAAAVANAVTSQHDEISVAIRAAEAFSRQEARARFSSSSELIHRLFVCISGVADQLQTNYAADLRHVLKCVFECNASQPDDDDVSDVQSDKTSSHDAFVNINVPPGDVTSADATTDNDGTTTPSTRDVSVSEEPQTPIEEPPSWVPDEQVTECSACETTFTLIRRRHHCRNCGKIYCSRCSSNFVPLPQYGHQRPVRVCNRCYVFHVTPFTVDDVIATAQ